MKIKLENYPFQCKIVKISGKIKKLLSIFILSIFLINILGTNIYFALERLSVKIKSEKNLGNIQKFTTIILTKEEFRRSLENENEINLNGEFYDISSTQHVYNKVVVNCIHDSLETELVNWFDSLPNKSDLKTIFFNFLFSLFFSSITCFIFPLLTWEGIKYYYLFRFNFKTNLAIFRPPKI